MATWSEQKGEPLAPRNYFPEPASKGNEVVRAIGSSPRRLTARSMQPCSPPSIVRNPGFSDQCLFVPDPQLLAALKERYSVE